MKMKKEQIGVSSNESLPARESIKASSGQIERSAAVANSESEAALQRKLSNTSGKNRRSAFLKNSAKGGGDSFDETLVSDPTKFIKIAGFLR